MNVDPRIAELADVIRKDAVHLSDYPAPASVGPVPDPGLEFAWQESLASKPQLTEGEES